MCRYRCHESKVVDDAIVETESGSAARVQVVVVGTALMSWRRHDVCLLSPDSSGRAAAANQVTINHSNRYQPHTLHPNNQQARPRSRTTTIQRTHLIHPHLQHRHTHFDGVKSAARRPPRRRSLCPVQAGIAWYAHNLRGRRCRIRLIRCRRVGRRKEFARPPLRKGAIVHLAANSCLSVSDNYHRTNSTTTENQPSAPPSSRRRLPSMSRQQ